MLINMGKAVRAVCVDAGITHASLAKKIGISSTRMSVVVNNQHMSTRQIMKICDATGIDISDFIELSKQKTTLDVKQDG